MGMFTKDVLYGGLRLDESIKIGTVEEGPTGGDRVVLIDAITIAAPIVTDIGTAYKTVLRIVKMDKDNNPKGDPIDCGTLASAIYGKVQDKEDGDLPAVVTFFVTPSSKAGNNDATVMQFVSPYDGAAPKAWDLPPLVDNTANGQNNPQNAQGTRTPSEDGPAL